MPRWCSIPVDTSASIGDGLQAAMSTKGAADAMASDGVLPETLVILVEAKPGAGG